MDKNEILEKSKRENRGYDEREAQIIAKAWQIGGAIGIIICGFAMLLLVALSDTPMRYGADNLMIYFGMIAAVYTYKAIKLRHKHEIAFAVIFWAFFIFFTATFISSFIK